jgi:hypothetical protein
MVNDFRTEANGLAADAEAFGIELDAIANPHGDGSLADLIAAAAVTLQHPTLALIAAEAERQGEQPEDGGEGASAPAPEAEQGEQPVDSGEGASAPAPEAGEGERPADGGEGAPAPAPEGGQGEQPVDGGEWGDEVNGGEGAPAPAQDEPNVIRVPEGTHSVRPRGKKPGDRRPRRER